MNLRNKIIALLLISINVNTYCQNENWNIKISGGPVTNGRELRQMNADHTALEPTFIFKESVPNMGFAAFYKFFKNFHGGIYGSYSKLSGAKEIVETGVINSWTEADAVYYGLQANYQILPLIIEKPLRFDFYATARLGGIYKWWEGYNNTQLTEDFLEAGLGFGAAINFSRKFGVFGEALGGRFYYSKYNWRTGISFNF